MKALPERLARIVADVRARNRERRLRIPLASLEGARRPNPGQEGSGAAFVRALSGPDTQVIAECKRRSPSAGQLVTSEDVLERARAYARGGAAALSVLTERDHFAGSRAQLVRARAAGLPILRKDFVLDEGMVLESAAMGASAVLLIVRCLEVERLQRCARRARALGLATLIEIHAQEELAAALDARPDAIGVNARDLDSFEIDLPRALELLARVPARVLRVAESGLHSPADVARARRAGADAVLVGSALVLAEDPEASLRALVEAGRSAR